jgi:hypothetical protein
MTISTEDKSLQFFDQVYTAYKKATAKMGGTIDYYYQIGGFNICLSFAGIKLINYIIPALEHLKVNPVKPDLKICIFHSESTEINREDWNWKNKDYREKGEIYILNNSRIHASNHWNDGGLNLLDKQRNLGIYWLQNTNIIPYWEIAAPLRVILHNWMLTKGLQYVHSAAVGTTEGGVLLVGKGGSGKSTTALSCLDSELYYLADDYCLVSPNLTIYSLYNTGKKNADDINRLPFLTKYISNIEQLEQEKAVYFLQTHFPDKMLSNCPLKAVLIPRITGEINTTITPTSPIKALIALAPSTIFQLAGSGKESFEIISEVIKKSKCYYLNLGTDIKQIPAVILKLLEEMK